MSKTIIFRKKLIATTIASIAAGVSINAFAADEAAVDEIVVTGIKASLTRSMDMKRDAIGVVDAVNAEDIGKMPDSNLAESLQRISGISISRSNGEGQSVTARGIDASLNMVTLNGRNMPAVANGGTGDQATRAFDFGNLASEGINGIEVYKTGKASITSGGLGATVNIKTLHPLDLKENKGSIGIKALHDSTVRSGAGDEITPELSGLYSWKNEESTLGVALIGSYQKRDNMRSNAFVNNWDVNKPFAATATVINGPAKDQLYNLPTDIRYVLEDQDRVRKNGQLTLQFRPTERLTATADYTYSENELSSSRAQQSIWFDTSNITSIKFNNHAVKTPEYINYAYDGYKDISFAHQLYGAVTQNNSVGFNLAYDATDAFKLVLDTHHSTAENRPTLWNGTNQTEVGMSANVVTSEYANFSHKLPIMGITMDDTLKTHGADRPWPNGNANNILDGGDISGAMATFRSDHTITTIDQTRLMGSYDFGSLGFFETAGINFGIESRDDVNWARSNPDQRATIGNWGGVNPSNFPDTYFTPRDFGKAFPDYTDTTHDAHFIHSGVNGDLRKVLERAEYLATQTQYNDGKNPDNPKTNWTSDNFNNFVNGKGQFDGNYNVNRKIEEEVKSAYLEFNSKFEVGGLPSHLTAGVRYETTDVTSTVAAAPVANLQQDDDNDWTNIYASGNAKTVRTGSYSNVLPSLDFDISPIDSLKTRVSVSKTIGRANYSDLKSDVSVGAYRRTATGGNPSLKPMESKNFDLSVEWYYSSDSYVSAGYFRKDVSNFIGTTTTQQALFGLKDLRNGPTAATARAQLQAAGIPETEASLFRQMKIVEGLDADSPATKLYAKNDDPLMMFAYSGPVNDKSALIDGFEIAVQQMFGESGVGIQANFTKVDADKDFNNLSLGAQFAMNGLADSANFTVFYDKDGIQGRLAYNWRNKYLETRDAGNNEPRYVAAFGQLDASASYNINEHLTLTAEAINLTSENSRKYGRDEDQMLSLEDLGPRYNLGVRYSF